MPLRLPEGYGQDIAMSGIAPNPDARPREGRDEWGALWVNIGISNLGEVKEFPLPDWSGWDTLNIPDIREPHRWEKIRAARETWPGKFIYAHGVSLYERCHFIRGLENVWTDIYTERDALCRLLDVLVEMDLYAVERFAEADIDAITWCDDWGLQDRLMIRPDDFRAIWKPRYARIYSAAHEAGLFTRLHSCGHIVEILDDLIECGLDIIQMDQQENMGLETLGERFGGRITFECPVDIQNTMARGNPEEIRAYTRKMVRCLGRPEGGFIANWYSDPVGAGHTDEAIAAMCEEFVRINRNYRALFQTPQG